MSEKNPSFDRLRQDYESIMKRRPSGPTLTNRSSSMISIRFDDDKEVQSVGRFEDDFKQELKQKLEKQRRSIDSYEEKPFASPLAATQSLTKAPHQFDGRLASYRVNIMEELKQKLNKAHHHHHQSPSYDVDRIVKETKTTTITQSKETIHFKKAAAGDRNVSLTTTPSASGGEGANTVTKCDNASALNSQRVMMKSEDKKNTLNHIFPSHIEQWESPRSNTLIRRE